MDLKGKKKTACNQQSISYYTCVHSPPWSGHVVALNYSYSVSLSHTFVQNDVIFTDFKALISIFRPFFLNSKWNENDIGEKIEKGLNIK